ncbi:hypothetical protein [Paucidesulfovibrio longus]|uniref:hypothetical protein n=1 Tax=Paucidesulfovibrio longus TaxID=889 RepID=UPI0003B77FA7|nr:hypothetical protein [Paucidesulfovibrio longus]
MLLHFPNLHPECVPGGPLPGVLFLDPGLEEASGEERFRPDGLPLDPSDARHLLDDCIRFGEQFANPKEMAFFGAQPAQADRGESVSVLESELKRRLGQGAAAQPQSGDPQAARAQFLLLLAWSLEERVIELRKLSLGMEQAWNRFGSTLGVEGDDALDEAEFKLDSLISNMQAPDSAVPSLPWPLLLEAVCAFVPKGAVLVVRDPEIVAALDDAGLEFAPAPAELGLPEGARVAEAPAWRMAGLAKEPEKRPLMARTMRMAAAPVKTD